MGERRGFQRFDCAGEISLRIVGGEPTAAAAVENISFGGMGLVVSGPVSVGARVRFSFATQLMEQPLAGTGLVRHESPAIGSRAGLRRIGIEFDDVNKDAVVQLLGRVQAGIAETLRVRNKIRPVDYIPY